MIQQLIKTIAQELDNHHVPYMLIGGQAVLLYGTPRLTRDIDVTLGIDVDNFLLIMTVCQVTGLRILPDNPEQFVKDTHVLPAADENSNMRVDFIFSFTPYERQAIEHAQRIEIDRYKVSFATKEDIIIHKMFAGRAVDEEDVKNIIIKNREDIDFVYVDKWLKDFSALPDRGNIKKRFANILKSI